VPAAGAKVAGENIFSKRGIRRREPESSPNEQIDHSILQFAHPMLKLPLDIISAGAYKLRRSHGIPSFAFARIRPRDKCFDTRKPLV
jgi:hypothetical protein